jgi:hypothetical protein
VQGQTLQQSHHETDAVGTGEFEVGRRGKFGVYLNDLLQQDGDGADGVPEQYGQVGVGFPLAAEEVEGLNQ